MRGVQSVAYIIVLSTVRVSFSNNVIAEVKVSFNNVIAEVKVSFLPIH